MTFHDQPDQGPQAASSSWSSDDATAWFQGKGWSEGLSEGLSEGG